MNCGIFVKNVNNPMNHNQKYIDAIKQAGKEGDESFFSFFNPPFKGDINQIIMKGCRDFNQSILTPIVHKAINGYSDKTALEIGYGGGRLMLPACHYFKFVVGIDIHEEIDLVDSFLKSHKINNYDLYKTDGHTLSLEKDNSLDFIYSFVVFQHLPSFEIFESYAREIHRCLKPNGIAQIYYGSFKRLDPEKQKKYLSQGYAEFPENPVNGVSLLVHEDKAKEMCGDFEIVDSGFTLSRKQDYVTLVKK